MNYTLFLPELQVPTENIWKKSTRCGDTAALYYIKSKLCCYHPAKCIPAGFFVIIFFRIPAPSPAVAPSTGRDKLPAFRSDLFYYTLFSLNLHNSEYAHDISERVQKRKNPESLRLQGRFSDFRLFFCFDDLFAVIVTAFRAHTVRHLQFVALGAFNQVRSSQFPVRATGITTCFGHFSLRYCHFTYTS